MESDLNKHFCKEMVFFKIICLGFSKYFKNLKQKGLTIAFYLNLKQNLRQELV